MARQSRNAPLARISCSEPKGQSKANKSAMRKLITAPPSQLILLDFLFNANTAHLAVLRADWHVVHLWDVMVEGRMLFTEQTGGHDSGILAGVYRHLGDNAKIGVGYEWGNVSDDLSAIDYQAQGIFLNLIAKY